MVIDCHQHFWRVDRGDYGWLDESLPELFRDYEPEDLQDTLKALGINKTIVVQAAPTINETEFLLSLAEQYDFIAGVVGWIDMESSDAVSNLDRLAMNSKLKGVRPMIQDIEDDNWMLKPQLEAAFLRLQENDLVFEALVFPRHLKNLKILLGRHPELKCVINHGAKPDIANRAFQAWADDMTHLAENTSSNCKLSGLLTEAGDNTRNEDLQPYVQHLFNAFGSSRLMWGSDWPVLNLAADYASWYSQAQRLIRGLSEESSSAVFGANAQAFYQV